jgi:hypothetical protein
VADAEFPPLSSATLLAAAEGDGFGSAAACALFVGRFSGLNLPACTGFFFGGMARRLEK